MIVKDLYVVNTGTINFRPYEPALVIGYKFVKPSENLEYRRCFEVRYSDGFVDYIVDNEDVNFYTLDDIANAMHLKDKTVEKEKVTEMTKTPFKLFQEFIESTKKYESKCLHDSCTSCNGTGFKNDGSMCVHMISCNCSKCNPFVTMFEGAIKW